MAKQISENASIAFYNNRKFKKDNTQVKVEYLSNNRIVTSMYLWGNKIAWKDNEGTHFTLCGWNTRTTKDRLSALGIKLYQRNGQLYWSVNRQTDKPIDSYSIYTWN